MPARLPCPRPLPRGAAGEYPSVWGPAHLRRISGFVAPPLTGPASGNARFGENMRDMGRWVFPHYPPSVLCAFVSNASRPDERTSAGEMGFFQIPGAGPGGHIRPHSGEWSLLANRGIAFDSWSLDYMERSSSSPLSGLVNSSDLIRGLLRRPVSNDWTRRPWRDSIAVGLFMLVHELENFHRITGPGMPTAGTRSWLVPNPASVWSVACTFSGWSAGASNPGPAWMVRFAAEKRDAGLTSDLHSPYVFWEYVVWLLEKHRRGAFSVTLHPNPNLRHSRNPPFTAFRTWQKLEAGRHAATLWGTAADEHFWGTALTANQYSVLQEALFRSLRECPPAGSTPFVMPRP